MFEIWESVVTPGRRVIVEEGETLPSELAGEPFKLLGVNPVAHDIAVQVERLGYVVVFTTMPYDPDGVIGVS